MVEGDETGRPRWSFTGDYNSPTFSPSVLARWPEWQGEGVPWAERVCHHFVRGGKIEFLNDCTHDLAGQIVPMVPLENEG